MLQFIRDANNRACIANVGNIHKKGLLRGEKPRKNSKKWSYMKNELTEITRKRAKFKKRKFCSSLIMAREIKKIISILFLMASINFYAQDSIVKYRVTTIQTSLSHFFLVAPQYPQLPRFFPSGIISIKSFRTDSVFNPEKKFHFMISLGAAASRFSLTDPEFFKNKLDKSPLYVLSKRFFGGFGLNKRYSVSKKFMLDIDIAPCYLIIWDKSEETRGDTALQESKGYEDIYQGLHLLVGAKLEYKTSVNYGFFFQSVGHTANNK